VLAQSIQQTKSDLKIKAQQQQHQHKLEEEIPVGKAVRYSQKVQDSIRKSFGGAQISEQEETMFASL